jgi:hypothetical protein
MHIALLRATQGTNKHNEGPHSWRGLKCGDKTKQTNKHQSQYIEIPIRWKQSFYGTHALKQRQKDQVAFLHRGSDSLYFPLTLHLSARSWFSLFIIFCSPHLHTNEICKETKSTNWSYWKFVRCQWMNESSCRYSNVLETITLIEGDTMIWVVSL